MPQVAWWLWIAITVALTARPYLWHLQYFTRPAPKFLPLYLAGLALLGVAMYWKRRPLRWELRGAAAFFAALFLVYQPVATLYAFWVWFVCFGLGRLLLGRLANGALEQVVLFTAAGLGLVSAGMFVLGLAGLYYQWVIVALLALGAAACWKNAARLGELFLRVERGYFAVLEGSPIKSNVCLTFVFVFSLLSALVVLSPEIAFDPVSFHFVFARDYALQHRLAAVPRLPYSYFPQNVEILYTLGFLLDGQALAKIVTYAYFPLAALALVLIGQRWFTARAGLIGAAWFVTTPFIAWTGSVAKNDLALALYLLLALYGVLRWIEEERFGWLAAGVFFLGLSFGVKHVAILGAVPLAALILWGWRRIRLSAGQVALVAVIFVCSGLYWQTRTYLLTGNPLYPEGGASATESKTAVGHPELSRLDRLRLYATIPWTVHFRGLFAFESPSENPIGFALVAFFPLLWWRGGPQNRGARAALFFAVAYFLYWAAILIKVRYAIAAFGVLFVWLGDRLDRFDRKSVRAMAIYCFVFALSLTLILEMNVPRLKLFARQIDEPEFLRESLVTYRAIEAINRVSHPGQLVYAVGNCSTFYSNIEFHCYYDAWNNYSLDQITRELRETHYQYLIVPRGWGEEPRHMHVVQAFYHVAPLYADDVFRVYRLER
jgi:hypothetical protein